MKFNVDSNFYKITTTVTQFIILNFLFILACLPIITIGTALSALLEVTMHYADQERGYLIKDFLVSFKNNWRASTKLFFLFAFPLVALFFGTIFWLSLQSILGTVIGLFTSFAFLYLILSLLIGEALVARYENTLRQTFKNALLLVISHPIKSMSLLAVPFVGAFLTLIMPGFRLPFLFVGCSFSAYCGAWLLLSIFSEHKKVIP